jgi:integrase/recombinase XerC
MSELGIQIERLLAELRARNSSPATILAYGADLHGFAAFFTAPPPVADFNVNLIREWMASLHKRGLGHKSIRRHVAAVRALFKMLKRNGLIGINPAALVLTPKYSDALPGVLSIAQMARFLDQVALAQNPPRDVAILELLYGTGIRVSEIVALKIGDIDRKDRWVLIKGKGKKERFVPYGRKAAEALENYLAGRETPAHGEPLFPGRGISPLTARAVNNLVKNYGTVYAGDPSLHPHSFRHAYATHLMNSGAELRVIQELLGHSSVSITAKYIHLSKEKISEVYADAHPKA